MGALNQTVAGPDYIGCLAYKSDPSFCQRAAGGMFAVPVTAEPGAEVKKIETVHSVRARRQGSDQDDPWGDPAEGARMEAGVPRRGAAALCGARLQVLPGTN